MPRGRRKHQWNMTWLILTGRRKRVVGRRNASLKIYEGS
jgi:hypothetical protein